MKMSQITVPNSFIQAGKYYLIGLLKKFIPCHAYYFNYRTCQV